MSGPPLPPPLTTKFFVQDYVVNTHIPTSSTITQLYDASRVVEKLESRILYYNVSTSVKHIGSPGPKFNSDRERMLYKLGQYSYLSPR